MIDGKWIDCKPIVANKGKDKGYGKGDFGKGGFGKGFGGCGYGGCGGFGKAPTKILGLLGSIAAPLPPFPAGGAEPGGIAILQSIHLPSIMLLSLLATMD
mmetsp:Transcript_7248/g.8319  ORF Transcript_7248/g.8319 Transcript_7248/m.8319 type:complete len:100 (+) Transcript_7248:350-649(+)